MTVEHATTPIRPVVLRGELVELRPLEAADRDALVAAAGDGELWRLQYTRIAAPHEMSATIESHLAEQRAGTMLPFTIRRAEDGAVIGHTTFCHIDALTPRVEIGYTWLARSAQRSGANAEAKLLLLTHAFDTLDCLAVEFRTHWLNHQSRRAIERLGAKQDGVLRNHQRMRDGSIRDTVVFSILPGEWPGVRAELLRRLGR